MLYYRQRKVIFHPALQSCPCLFLQATTSISHDEDDDLMCVGSVACHKVPRVPPFPRPPPPTKLLVQDEIRLHVFHKSPLFKTHRAANNPPWKILPSKRTVYSLGKDFIWASTNLHAGWFKFHCVFPKALHSLSLGCLSILHRTMNDTVHFIVFFSTHRPLFSLAFFLQERIYRFHVFYKQQNGCNLVREKREGAMVILIFYIDGILKQHKFVESTVLLKKQ